MAERPPTPMRLAIGEPIFALETRHPDLVRLDGAFDNQPIVIDEPVALTLAGGADLALPPTRFVQISQAAGTIVGVFTSPMLSYALLEEAHALALRLMQTLEAGGWRVAERGPTSLAAVQAGARAAPEGYDHSMGAYARGPLRLDLSIAEAENLPPFERERLFLVNLQVRDPGLDDRMNALLFEKRQKVNGDTTSLPLAAWR